MDASDNGNGRRQAAACAAAPAAERRIEYRRITCAELATANYDLEYLVDGLLVAGQPCIFAGAKKTLKTSLLIALGLSLASGEAFLGWFAIRRACRVMMMTGESGMATIQETALRIASAMGITLADVASLVFSPELPMFGHSLHADALRQMMKDDEIEVLIIDPAYLAMPTDGNEASLFAMGALLRGVSELCHECGVTLILAHHTKKTLRDPHAMPELDDIAWSGFSEFARQWVLLARREQFGPGSGEHRLWLNVGGSAGHSSCWALDVSEGVYDGHTPRHWHVTLTRPNEARLEAAKRQHGAKDAERRATAAAQLATDRATIVSAMQSLDNHTGTKTDIRDACGINTKRFDAAFASLIRDRTAKKTTIRKGNNRTYDAVQLRDSADD